MDEGTGRRLSSEVTITPEMIEAGARALKLFDDEYSSPKEGLRLILEAALNAGEFKVNYT